jgi:type VI secretion system protein ImpE
MGARELLQAGQLDAAIEAGIQDVKAAPGDTRARIFLFELLAAAGDFERAKKHLDVVSDQAPGMADGVRSYLGLLEAEATRARLFATGTGNPQRMTRHPLEPEPELTALRHLRSGAVAEAAALLEQSAAARAPRPGAVDGRRFEDFRDADDLLAPYLEVFANGLYGWIPFVQIRKLEFEAPRYFRDLLWRPVTVTLTTDEDSAMLVPVRYPGSETQRNDQLRLGRATDWTETGSVVTGLGQRVFAVGEESCAMLEVSEISFDA